jgi:Fe-S cluster biogenesis protein NfuA
MDLRAEEIQITGEPTFDPQVCRFRLDRTLLEEAGVRCNDPTQAAGSPLLEKLFAVDGVREVYVFGSTLMIAKQGEESWPDIGRRIGTAIREALVAGGTLIAEELLHRTPAEEELRERVQRLFDEQINPSLAGHGGFVEIADVRGCELYLTMGGGCQGCASAQMTLRQGVERAIRAQVPEVTAVYDVTDHASGHNPYYR